MARKFWPGPFRYFKDVRTFLIIISMVVSVGVAATYLIRYLTVNELLIQTVRHEAESFARLIVLTRGQAHEMAEALEIARISLKSVTERQPPGKRSRYCQSGPRIPCLRSTANAFSLKESKKETKSESGDSAMSPGT